MQSNPYGTTALDRSYRERVADFENFGGLGGRYRATHWNAEQGLPQNTVNALYQTRDGYVWFGTVFGLVRYDGVQFTTYDKSSLPIMTQTDDHIHGLTEDSEGSLWVTTQQGLLRLKDHEWTHHLRGGPVLGTNECLGICPAKPGGIWVGSFSKLLRFKDEGVVEDLPVPIPNRRSIRHVVEDGAGVVWFADRYGLMNYDPRSREFKLVGEFDRSGGFVEYVRVDRSGRVCFGGARGAYRVERGELRRLIASNPGPGGALRQVNDFLDDQGTRSWVIQNQELYLMDFPANGPAQILGKHPHPALTTCDSLLRDNEGNIWVGTGGDGVVFLQERRLSTLLPSPVRRECDVWSVCEDSRGRIWFGASVGLYCWNAGIMSRYNHPRADLQGQQYFTVAPDPLGGVWAGTASAGLFHLDPDGDRWNLSPHWDVRALEPKHHVRGLLTEGVDKLWYGTPEGLFLVESNATRPVPLPGRTAAKDVRAILRARDGALWVGTYAAGIAVLDGGPGRVYQQADGLPDNQISCLLEDSEGTLWIGTPSGLCRFKDGRFATLTFSRGLYHNVVNCILEDDDGRFWVSCNRGIYRFSRADANRVLDGVDETLACMPFGESDGMQSSETNGGNQPAGWKGRDGTLWFATTRGVVQVNPADIRGNVRPPQVVIERMKSGDTIRFGDGRQGPAGPGRATSGAVSRRDGGGTPELFLAAGEARVLEIRYTANSFEEPSKVRFRYKLEGHDKFWRGADDRRVTHYTNLDPGRYEFQIYACNNHGVQGPINTQLRFTVGRFYYQTWWFYAACGLAVISAAAGVQSYRLSIQRRILQLEGQHALERERARIAKDVHDDLGARLTQLGLISELVESPGFQVQDGSGTLPKVSSLAREAVRSLDEIVWSVTPGKSSLDQLAGYLAQTAQDLLHPSGLSFRLGMPRVVEPLPMAVELRHNIFMVCKEALNNAVKHSGARSVALDLVIGTDSATITVSDDGRGFDPAEAEHSGNGLANMRKRAEAVGCMFSLTSAPELGTGMEIQFPLNRAISPATP